MCTNIANHRHQDTPVSTEAKASADAAWEVTEMLRANHTDQRIVREFFERNALSFLANDNVSDIVTEEMRARAQQAVEYHLDAALRAMFIDVDADHNTKETGRRWAKMMVRETFAGRFDTLPSITTFKNVHGVDELYTVSPITLRSTCAHHLVPITGSVHIGVLPSKESDLIGLSKFHRVVNHVASRPQIQEELTKQIADELEALMHPEGLAIVVDAKHLCCGHRGVKDPSSTMKTSIMRGRFRNDQNLRNEFLSLIDRN